MRYLNKPALLFLIIISCSISLKSAEDTGDNIEEVAVKIENEKKRRNAIEEEIVSKIREIKETVDNYSKSENEMKGLNGLGRIEQLELKAVRYSLERRARKIVEEEVETLIKMLEEWDNCKKKLKEYNKLLTLEQKIAQMKKKEFKEVKTENLDKTDIEYYEVKQEATLREISALPSVYGSPSLWKHLYEANTDKIKDPSDPVPVGTVLTVPSLNIEQEFGDLE